MFWTLEIGMVFLSNADTSSNSEDCQMMMTRHLLNLRFLHRRDQRDFVGTSENRPQTQLIIHISFLYLCFCLYFYLYMNLYLHWTLWELWRASLRLSSSHSCRKWWMSLTNICRFNWIQKLGKSSQRVGLNNWWFTRVLICEIFRQINSSSNPSHNNPPPYIFSQTLGLHWLVMHWRAHLTALSISKEKCEPLRWAVRLKSKREIESTMTSQCSRNMSLLPLLHYLLTSHHSLHARFTPVNLRSLPVTNWAYQRS